MKRAAASRGRKHWRTIVRAAAVLLLMLAAADLALPQICRKNASRLPAAQAASLQAQQDGGNRGSDETQREDCFCCCSHIVSAEPQTLLTSLPTTESDCFGRNLDEPSVPVLSLFRPPRLA